MRKNIMAVTATALVMTFIALVSCNRDYEAAAPYQTPAGTAYLRVVHAAPNFSTLFGSVRVRDSINILVGGTKISGFLSGGNPYMSYGSIYPLGSTLYGYVSVPAGEQEIKLTTGVTNPDSITLKTFSKVLAPDTYYSFLITDSINSQRDAAQIFVKDSLTTPTIGYFNLRFIHAVLEDATVKTVDTIDVFSTRNNRNIYSKITPGTVTTFSQFAYNSQLNDTLYVRRVRSTTNLATLNNVAFGNQRTYTLYFQGDGTLTTGKVKSLATYVHK
ncbi:MULTISPECIES: DUF4397 domain-containing protein [Niastella]|uniref:DUF4397 domain-containing protein n=1 Tax=Niastella soli TaxID=2821487 RepID=A0ABS3Z0I5_9BACT|nr:DUF4397 domain-containing protein [Niastella soli]MBO9203185.1 DUF4397 domain-containing protein [Niastella soli]